MGKHELAL